MTEQVVSPPEVTYTASGLRKLPPAERDAILTRAVVEAEYEYRTNRELTDFEAFGEDDLFGESTGGETR